MFETTKIIIIILNHLKFHFIYKRKLFFNWISRKIFISKYWNFYKENKNDLKVKNRKISIIRNLKNIIKYLNKILF